MHTRTIRTTPRRLRLAAAVLAGALALAACGDGDGANEAAGPEPATGSSDEAASPSEEGGDPGTGGDETATPLEELTAEDGWLELHDLEIPGPGEGVLQVAGETIELEVFCDASGPLEEHGYLLFWFQATGTGEDAEGRAVRASVSRQILTVEEAGKSVYEYQGQESGTVQINVDIGDGMTHSAIVTSPADDDPSGSLLPVVHVDATGAFTVDKEVPPLASIHDQALHGHVRYAGRCQDTWPDDASI